MALPKQPLSTQDRRPLALGYLQQFFHPILERIGEHVVGVIAKPSVFQAEFAQL
jgi:hypothetical protein